MSVAVALRRASLVAHARAVLVSATSKPQPCHRMTATARFAWWRSLTCVYELSSSWPSATVALAGDGPDGGERGTPPAVFETM